MIMCVCNPESMLLPEETDRLIEHADRSVSSLTRALIGGQQGISLTDSLYFPMITMLTGRNIALSVTVEKQRVRDLLSYIMSKLDESSALGPLCGHHLESLLGPGMADESPIAGTE